MAHQSDSRQLYVLVPAGQTEALPLGSILVELVDSSLSVGPMQAVLRSPVEEPTQGTGRGSYANPVPLQIMVPQPANPVPPQPANPVPIQIMVQQPANPVPPQPANPVPIQIMVPQPANQVPPLPANPVPIQIMVPQPAPLAQPMPFAYISHVNPPVIQSEYSGAGGETVPLEANPNPKANPPFTPTVDQRIPAMLYIGLLGLIFILMCVSLSLKWGDCPGCDNMIVAEHIRLALGILTIILTAAIIVRLILLQMFRKTVLKGRIAKIAPIVAAALWCIIVLAFIGLYVEEDYEEVVYEEVDYEDGVGPGSGFYLGAVLCGLHVVGAVVNLVTIRPLLRE